MTEPVDEFLREAARLSSTTTTAVLAAVLHLDVDNDARFAALLPGTDDSVKSLFTLLDRQIRLRNPGLHYVERKMYLAYRRERETEPGAGERSQIFLTIPRAPKVLEVLLPIDPDRHDGFPLARSLKGKGHHGIGDLSCRLTTESDVELFLKRFDFWLRPPRP